MLRRSLREKDKVLNAEIAFVLILVIAFGTEFALVMIREDNFETTIKDVVAMSIRRSCDFLRHFNFIIVQKIRCETMQ